MKAQNVRLGFATNSSSSHSIVFFEDGVSDKGGGAPHDDFEFGWEMFKLSGVAEKLSYLAVAVRDTLRERKFPDRMASVVLSDLFAGTPVEGRISEVMEGYIDHQSAFTVAHNGLSDLERNVRDYVEVFSDPRIVVFGGNDNSEDHYQGNKPRLSLGGDYRASARARKDGDAIVLFNLRNGAKIRLSSKPYEKATVPELVDVKITDRCPYRCSFCYQGSLPDGDEPESYRINTIFDALGKLGTFEVAIGGGEPTSHKRFAAVIDGALNAGLVPNFTTFAVDWLLDDEKVAAAARCGGIGVSVHSERDYAKVEKIRKRLPNVQVMAQHVFGTMTPRDTKRLLWDAKRDNIPVLLLGFKNTGFGADYKAHDMDDFTKHLHKDSLPRLSVDTAFVERHADVIKELDINPALVSAREGAFSMYIDAVKWKAGPSSYCEPSQMKELPSGHQSYLASAIRSAFASY